MRIKSVVHPLVGINIVVFVLQLIPAFGTTFTEMFMLIPSDIFVRPWILVTSMFLHSYSLNHIFFNMYGLLIFGPLLEQRIGWKRFLLVYLTSGILAAVGHVFISTFLFGSAAPALGASGAIMGIIGALIILLPNLRLLLFFILPMPLWMAGIIWVAIDFFGVFVNNGIANIAHLVGVATGLSFALYLKKTKHKVQKRLKGKTHFSMDEADEFLRSGRI